MIDSHELRAIRQRANAAKRAVDTVEVHADGGLFGEIPLSVAAQLFPAAVSSARDVPRLLAEVERLQPASYVEGRQECLEGDCIDGGQSPVGELCPHLTERVATLRDVQRAEALAELVERVQSRLCEEALGAVPEWVTDLIRQIDDTLAVLDDMDGSAAAAPAAGGAW